MNCSSEYAGKNIFMNLDCKGLVSLLRSFAELNQLLQPLDADIVLEMVDIFKEFIPFEPSRRLMQYAEMLMTDGKADPVHNNTVAFCNCMIRIPNSYNSKYIPEDSNGEPILSSITPQSRVRIEQLSNGYKPNIRYLLEGLWESLIQLRNDEISDRLLNEQRRIRFDAMLKDM